MPGAPGAKGGRAAADAAVAMAATEARVAPTATRRDVLRMWGVSSCRRSNWTLRLWRMRAGIVQSVGQRWPAAGLAGFSRNKRTRWPRNRPGATASTWRRFSVGRDELLLFGGPLQRHRG